MLRHRSSLNLLLAIVIAVIAAVCAAVLGRPVARAQQSTPRLVVLLMVDQMRADYIEQFGSRWTGGLRRLIDRGARFVDAAYPYLNTVTCAGHATVSTGAFPSRHGMTSNYWHDRVSGRRLGCTDDAEASTISYDKASDAHDSPRTLLLPTLSDELAAQRSTPPKVASVSLKDRTAIVLAGTRSDATVWFDDRAQSFVTSSAYAKAPVPFLVDFFKTQRIDRDYGKTWSRMRPDDQYQYADAAVGEFPPTGWTATFPHVLAGKNGTPDAQFYELWKESPYSDAYLSAIAQSAVTSLGMGKGDRIDYLAISFSALDNVGHDFGPRSHEVQDVLMRLDETLAGLFRFLDTTVGADRYVAALTADHGVSVIPEQTTAEGKPAGRVRLDDFRKRIEAALAPLGPGQHVARIEYADIYFANGVYDRLTRDAALMSAVTKAILDTPGVVKVFRAEELAANTPTDDPDLQAARLSYSAGRSGDMMNILAPNYIHVTATQTSATTHGTRQPYDARVPVIFMGAGIRPGTYPGAATPADVAPTLASFCGIRMPKADGKVLSIARASSQQ